MGDPVGAAIMSEIAGPHGTWMIVEPFCGGSVGINLNPVGRIYYSASKLLCTQVLYHRR